MPRNSGKPRQPYESTDFVAVVGAREHNLKGVDLSFPRDSLTTFTGVSGSGKSSLAYHTIYQEGQRRFLESLSSYARQFLGRMEKPRVDHVEGLSPTVSIDQKSAGYGARSTVGTLTEVMDFLRLFMARLGVPACPRCGAAIESWSVDRIAGSMLEDHAGQAVLILAPVVRERKGEYRKELSQYRTRGFVRARIDGEVRRLDEEIELHRYKYHTIELVVDRLRLGDGVGSRLTEAVEQGLSLGGGLVALLGAGEQYRSYSTQRACPEGHGSVPEMEPRLFSFNSPVGACPHCEGLGEVHSFSEELLVRDPELSIREGALHGIKPDSGLVYSRLTMDNLETVAEAYGFDLDTPWRRLGRRLQKIVLHGSGERRFEFRWQRGGQHRRTSGRDRRAFPGLIPHLEQVYRPHRARHLDRYRASVSCPQCEGGRLGPVARAVTFEGRNLPEWLAWTVDDALRYFEGVELKGNALAIGGEILREVVRRLTFLREVGLGYLTLDRRARTLAGGEAQRIRLAAQVGAGLRGILYVLDEPSIGLHPRDQGRLLNTLKALRDRGNTVCVVEHDQDTMEQSDFLVDIGPGAGRHGGEVVVAGETAVVREHPDSITGKYLRGETSIPLPVRRIGHSGELVVRGARQHNLAKITVRFPLGRLVAVTGVSGSGKSTLVNHILKRVLRRELMRAEDVPGRHDKIEGLEHLDKVVEIDQSPIGRTPRSNPGTYTGIWTHIRDLFAMLPESRVRDYKKGRFSFNVKGGRCEGCDGAGVKTLEMNFLAPVEVLCEDCQGRRFNQETLEIRFKSRNVYDLLEMTVDEAYELFADFPKIERGLTTLRDVGLGYIRLGQPSTTLSGGEAQRVKLATELQRPATGRTIYLLDEPTTGLHFEDIARLLSCLQALVDAGNSVVVIEHNLDVIKCADHVIDLGPEGGAGGGRVVATGTPEELARNADCHTGRALKPLLRRVRRTSSRPARKVRRRPPIRSIHVQGASVNNLKSVDVKLPLDRMTVITGVSGSGKSSLAFDTLFNEGQRRFIESMSTYARRFLGRMDQAPVHKLEGLGPAIAIDQRATSRSPRSTVATTTEIHDYLRLLYARVGRPHCPQHGQELVLHSPGHIAREVLAAFAGQRGYILAPERIPDGLENKGLTDFLERLRRRWLQDGFVRAVVDGEVVRLDEPLAVPDNEILLVVDRVSFRERGRIVDSAAQASEQSGGLVVVRSESGEQLIFSTDRSCPHCGHGVPVDPHPRYFSFNHHSGACEACSGLGEMSAVDPQLLVNKPNKPLFRGAIRHSGAAFTFLTRRSGWYHKVAVEVAKHHGFDLDQPFDELPEGAVQILLHGAGEERFDVTYRRRRASSSRTWRMSVFWKGLCRQIEEWYHNQEHGEKRFRALMRVRPCAECQGERLQLGQRHVLVGGIGLPRLTGNTVTEAQRFFDRLRLRKTEAVVARETLREIAGRLSFLQEVGLGYLTLDRSSATLSGGEAQRIRLATQLGNRLVGVLYVLDEPTIGLHPRDTELLLGTLRGLRDLGNTVVVVEHDEHVMRAADHVVDMGPGAGHRGGEVVASGTPARVAASRGLTGRYLRGDLHIPVPTHRRGGSNTLRLRGIEVHNLKGLDLELPLGALTAVTGVSGSGKSSLVMDALVPALTAGDVEVRGLRSYSAVVVDQSPIGTTPASNPATYTGVMDPIRQLYARLPQSRTKGFGPGRFSFNVHGGRCDACEGKGQLKVEMHFLADVWVTCETCGGKRYNTETLAVDHRGRNIAQVLSMEVAEALEFFGDLPRIARPLKLLADVGLGYLRLGQSANTLSGGEAQRIKLVAQLTKAPRQHNIYLLDEPTTGLHMDDVAKLVAVLQRLVERGDTVVVIEHHLDVIQCADRVIELGPEAGDAGGEIVVAGTPEQVADHPTSHTGRFLRQHLRKRPSPRSRPSKQEAS